MLGRIIGIEGNKVIINLDIDVNECENLVNLHVSMKDDKVEVIGEVMDIKDNQMFVNMLGQMIDGKFVSGVSKKPSFGADVQLVSKKLISSIISVGKFDEAKHLMIGKSAVYEDIDVAVDINGFFQEHFAIFGNTGSGKSCGVSRIFQNLFSKINPVPYKASIFLFDAYGEYHSAFNKLHKKVPEIGFKAYTTNLNDKESNRITIPIWLLSVDDIALLLGADKHSQIPIIEKAMKLVNVFARKEEEVIKSKNDIIARALIDILSSGKSPAQIRDQLFSVLTYYNTSELNLDTEIVQPGYTRPIKNCLNIDATGKLREMELVVSFLETFISDDYELSLPDGSFKYTLADLSLAFDFALISEGVLSSDKIFDEANILKVRMHALANGDESVYFDHEEYVTRSEYIRELLTMDNGRKAQIINFNINYIDDRLAKNITKIYSKLLFDYSKGMEKRASLPFHIVLEEAHRYVQNDIDKFLLGYNIFERITKEGRKYGVILGLITQRPSELSETAISQCSNFLIFKMLHPTDVAYINEMVPNITPEVIKKLKTLQPGSCIAFGQAFKVPVIIKLELPDPLPSSNSCDIVGTWFIRRSNHE